MIKTIFNASCLPQYSVDSDPKATPQIHFIVSAVILDGTHLLNSSHSPLMAVCSMLTRDGFLKSDPIRLQNCQFFVQFFIGYHICILNDF